MKIAIDAMGGDNAPLEIVRGALEGAKRTGAGLILTGNGEVLLECLQKLKMDTLPENVEFADAREVIDPEEEPVSAIRRKRDASMSRALQILREGGADAAISAGSTGALIAGATLIVKRLPGVRRVALAPLIPTGEGSCILIDAGANAECTPEMLLQFARMGSVCAAKTLRIRQPRVGMLNIGSESGKGGSLQKETWELLSKAGASGTLNFVGNVEPSAAIQGACDVLVTDGVCGNILLKSMEGTGKLLFGELKNTLKKGFKGKLAGLLVGGELRRSRSRFDPAKVGGTLVLGASAPVIKAHGNSNAEAICAAVEQACRLVQSGFTKELSTALQRQMKEGTEA